MMEHYHLSIVNAALVLLVVGFILMVYKFNQSSENVYNAVDMLMGPNNRASLTNHILLFSFGLACWVVIDRELDGRDDVGSILLGILGIFVLGKTATAITDALNKPAEGSTTTTTTAATETTETVKVNPIAKRKGGKRP